MSIKSSSTMTYRVRRQCTCTTFRVDGQLCKIFLEPKFEYKPGFFVWNTGFSLGKSKRQINDWYWNRKNKRRRSLQNRLVGRSGLKAIRRGFEEVLKLRWCIEPGDCLILDCTSGDPERQFHAWSRWRRYHPEWGCNDSRREFFWYRPPYENDPLREIYKFRSITPADPLANTNEQRYFDCFQLLSVIPGKAQSMEQTHDQSFQDPIME